MAQVTNEELVRKAVIATDALASSGKLNPAQADKFIDYVVDVTGLKDNARVIRFRNEQLNIDKIGVGARVAMPAAEAAAPSARRGVTTTQVRLQPVEIIVPFEIGDTFREVNLEGDNIEDHIVKMMATQLANDLETLYIEGDTLGRADTSDNLNGDGNTTQYVKDTYLALCDGWLKLSRSGNAVDMAGQNVGANAFSKMLNALPAKFKRNRKNLRFISSIDMEQAYREKVSTRATATGDNALSSNSDLTPYGIPLVPFPLFPFHPRTVEHCTMTGTAAQSLLSQNVANVVVAPSTLAGSATTPYAETTDYTVDYANGTVTRVGGGAITGGQVVKVTYDAAPQLILTHMDNFIVGIGRDIRIERDRDIFKRVNQYAITVKVAVQVEELTALTWAKNFGTGV